MPALYNIWFVFIVQTCSKYGYDSLIHSFRWILFADQLLDLALVVDEWFFSQCFFCHMRKNTISHSSMQSLPCAMVKHKIEFRKGHVSMALTRVLFYSQHEPHNWILYIVYIYIYVLCVHVLLQENIQRHHLVFIPGKATDLFLTPNTLQSEPVQTTGFHFALWVPRQMLQGICWVISWIHPSWKHD